MGTLVLQFLQDLRFGVRNLVKSPGFAAVAVLSLALGIGATTAIYSVIYAVVLHPFPYKDVDTLMSVKVWEPGRRGFRLYYSTDQFLEIERRSTIFERVIASTISDVLWTGAGEPQRLRGNHVTRGTFETMGVPPLLGRALGDADFVPGAPPACVLGHRFWQRQFGADPGVLGRQLRLNDQVRTVVGVMPRRFMWRGADVYLPITYRPGVVTEGVRWVHVLGRLRPGVTEAQAEADLRPIIADLKRRQPAEFPEQFRVGLLSFAETFPSAIRQALWILFGAVGLLLVIACANVSNLLLSRSVTRRREMAVRAALGAGRGRLARQLLSESLVLAAAGAAGGIALAWAGLRAILGILPPGTIPDESVVELNAPVLLFTAAVAVSTALLFGLAPALYAGSANLAQPLRAAARGLAGGFRQAALRNGLVVVEVALSLMLLVGASLMIRTVIAMQNVDLGIRTDRLLTMRIPLREDRYPDPVRRTAFFRGLLERVRSLPGVAAADLNTGVHPMGNWTVPVEVPGSPQRDRRPVVLHQVGDEYLRAMGIAVVQGRPLAASEIFAGRHIALVNQAFVRRYLPAGHVLGTLVRIPAMKDPPVSAADDSLQIAGVVRDTRNRALNDEILPEVYVPFTIAALADRLIVLTHGDPAAVANAVRAQVYALDRDQPVTDVRTIGRMLDDWVYSGPRANMALFSVFAAIGLALAVIGIYGVIAHGVSQQTQEIGVRIALGAGFAQVAGMVLRRGLALVGAGIALGLAGALAGTRLLAQQIWNVSPLDPLSFGAVSAVLLAAGLQACFWPARRAARIDPAVALRSE